MEMYANKTPPLDTLSRGDEVALGTAQDTIDQSYDPFGDNTTLEMQMRMSMGRKPGYLDQMEASMKSRHHVNETLYSTLD